MFTGLVTAVGAVLEMQHRDGGNDLRIKMPWDDLALGESIAIDGVCLTVTAMGEGWFQVHVTATSLERTNFDAYPLGRAVNLERALRIGDRLGGHMVQGHVDGCGTVIRVVNGDDVRLLDIAVPAEVLLVSVPLGSVTVDGVSLTINRFVGTDAIQLSIIPFTLQHTTLIERLPGDRVHLEGDMVGKYLRAFVKSSGPAEGGC